MSSIHGCQCQYQVPAAWAAAHARPLLTPRCDKRLVMLLLHPSRLRVALPWLTAAANQWRFAGWTLSTRWSGRASPFSPIPGRREHACSRASSCSAVIGAPKARYMSFLGAWSLFHVTIGGLCACFGNYITTIHRPCLCVHVV